MLAADSDTPWDLHGDSMGFDWMDLESEEFAGIQSVRRRRRLPAPDLDESQNDGLDDPAATPLENDGSRRRVRFTYLYSF